MKWRQDIILGSQNKKCKSKILIVHTLSTVPLLKRFELCFIHNFQCSSFTSNSIHNAVYTFTFRYLCVFILQQDKTISFSPPSLADTFCKRWMQWSALVLGSPAQPFLSLLVYLGLHAFISQGHPCMRPLLHRPAVKDWTSYHT